MYSKSKNFMFFGYVAMYNFRICLKVEAACIPCRKVRVRVKQWLPLLVTQQSKLERTWATQGPGPCPRPSGMQRTSHLVHSALSREKMLLNNQVEEPVLGYSDGCARGDIHRWSGCFWSAGKLVHMLEGWIQVGHSVFGLQSGIQENDSFRKFWEFLPFPPSLYSSSVLSGNLIFDHDFVLWDCLIVLVLRKKERERIPLWF